MRFPLRRAMTVLALLGVALATYLTVVHYAGLKPACTAGQACVKVQTSQWSELAGVPVALIGLIGYIVILGALLAPDREETRLAVLGMTMVGFGFSGYLTYRYVIVPQALRLIVPSLTSEVMGIYKNTSVALTIGLMELTATSRSKTTAPFISEHDFLSVI